jgi:hypothetical protein
MRSTLDSIMTQYLVLPIPYVISKVDAHWFSSTNPIKMLDKYVNKVIEMHKPRQVVIFFPAAASAQNCKKDPYCDAIRGSFDVYVGAGPTDRR